MVITEFTYQLMSFLRTNELNFFVSCSLTDSTQSKAPYLKKIIPNIYFTIQRGIFHNPARYFTKY